MKSRWRRWRYQKSWEATELRRIRIRRTREPIVLLPPRLPKISRARLEIAEDISYGETKSWKVAG